MKNSKMLKINKLILIFQVKIKLINNDKYFYNKIKKKKK